LPYRQRLTEEALKDFETKLKEAPERWTKEALWNAFSQTEPKKVRGQVKRFTDLVSIVRFALDQEPVLMPFEEHVKARFKEWLDVKSKGGVAFSADEMAWLEKMRDAVAASGSVDKERLELAGELGQVYRVFGERLWPLMDELNMALVA
jgi:type I restriction enzyme R subunit